MEDGGEGDYGLGAEQGRSIISEEGENCYVEQKLPWGGLGLDKRTKNPISISRAWMLLAENGLGE